MAGGVVVRGQQALKEAMNKFAFNLDQAVDDAVNKTAFIVQREAIKSIAERSHSGRFVKRGEKGQHEISEEGDAPNADSGRLMGSIQVSHNRGDQIALVGTNLDYGSILETEKNRPWLEPAKESQAGKFGDRMKEAIETQVKKAGK